MAAAERMLAKLLSRSYLHIGTQHRDAEADADEACWQTCADAFRAVRAARRALHTSSVESWSAVLSHLNAAAARVPGLREYLLAAACDGAEAGADVEAGSLPFSPRWLGLVSAFVLKSGHWVSALASLRVSLA